MSGVLDTHAILWYLLDVKNLSPAAFSFIDHAATSGSPIYISAISLVEVAYLAERGRIPVNAFDLLIAELETKNSAFTISVIDRDIAESLRNISRDLVPDMPDRIIAATAVYLKLPLITCDARIRSLGIHTIW